MKQVAKRACQVRNKVGKLVTLYTGEVIDFDGKHIHLRPINTASAPKGTAPIDFATASEEELFETEYDLEELKDYIKSRFNVPVRVRSQKSLIEKLLDCRFREVNYSDITRLD